MTIHLVGPQSNQSLPKLVVPSTYHHHKALERNPERRTARAKRDENLVPEIRRVWEESHHNYGARKVWKTLHHNDTL